MRYAAAMRWMDPKRPNSCEIPARLNAKPRPNSCESPARFVAKPRPDSMRICIGHAHDRAAFVRSSRGGSAHQQRAVDIFYDGIRDAAEQQLVQTMAAVCTCHYVIGLPFLGDFDNRGRSFSGFGHCANHCVGDLSLECFRGCRARFIGLSCRQVSGQ